MAKKLDELKEQRNKLNQQIALLESLPEDIYPFGTVALFSDEDKKWFYLKTGEEQWIQLKGNSNVEKSLAEWIFNARQFNTPSYFEVYIMTPEPTPLYASA